MECIAKYTGDETWCWESCDARWRSLSTFHCKDPEIPAGLEKYVNPKPGTYTTDGPLQIGYPAQWDFDVTCMVDIWEANGFPINTDTNSGDALGVTCVPLTSRKGT